LDNHVFLEEIFKLLFAQVATNPYQLQFLTVIYPYNNPTVFTYLYEAAGNKLKKTFNGINSYYQGSVLKINNQSNVSNPIGDYSGVKGLVEILFV
jgi:hypothetical protein